MKIKLVLAALLILLLNTGSSCVNDSILVAVNLPISAQWPINGGNNTNFNATATAVELADQIDDSYTDKVQNARYYDIRVSVIGDLLGQRERNCHHWNRHRRTRFRSSRSAVPGPISRRRSRSLAPHRISRRNRRALLFS